MKSHPGLNKKKLYKDTYLKQARNSLAKQSMSNGPILCFSRGWRINGVKYIDAICLKNWQIISMALLCKTILEGLGRPWNEFVYLVKPTYFIITGMK